MALRNQALELSVRKMVLAETRNHNFQQYSSLTITQMPLTEEKKAKHVLQPVPTKDDPVQHWLLTTSVIRPGSQIIKLLWPTLQYMSLLFPELLLRNNVLISNMIPLKG